MKNFMKTILSAVQTWTKGKIKESTADWNQNDSSADNYVKNRTHWEEEVEKEVVVLSQSAITIESGGVENIDFNVYLEEGLTYTVIWNGEIYECLARNDGYDDIYIGNQTLSDGWSFPETIASSEPFFIATYAKNNWNTIRAEQGEYAVGIYVSTTQTVVHTLDAKYLPEEYATVEEVQTAQTTAETAQATADGAQSTADNAQATADGKMDATNPVGTGSFSMNRKSGNAVGNYSISLGYNCTASGEYSLAEGYSAAAYGNGSHAEGWSTRATSNSSHVQGKNNIEDTDAKYAHIVGNGTSNDARSNAHTLDWDGNAWFQGDVYVGSTDGVNRDDGSKKLATEEYTDNAVSQKAQVQIITWEADD